MYSSQYLKNPASSTSGLVFFVPPTGLLHQSSFVFDSEGWTVSNNGIGSELGGSIGAIQHAPIMEGRLLSRYVFAKDADVQVAAKSVVDKSPWYFKAPNSFFRHAMAAVGGHLNMIISIFPEYTFSDIGLLHNALPLVEFDCASCPVGAQVFRYYLPKDQWPSSHEAIRINVPMQFGNWRRGQLGWASQLSNEGTPPRHSRVDTSVLHFNRSTAVCECEFWRAVQGMSNLRIYGDVTDTVETFKLDKVQLITPETGAVPVHPGCLQQRTASTFISD
jgi:hypothetical protein